PTQPMRKRFCGFSRMMNCPTQEMTLAVYACRDVYDTTPRPRCAHTCRDSWYWNRLTAAFRTVRESHKVWNLRLISASRQCLSMIPELEVVGNWAICQY